MDTIEASSGSTTILRLRWYDSNPFKLLLAKMPNSISVQWEKRLIEFSQHISMEALSQKMCLPIYNLVPVSANKELEKTILSSKGMGVVKTFYYGYPTLQGIIQQAFPQYWKEVNTDLIATDGSYRKGELGAGCGIVWEPNQGTNCLLLGADNVYPAELMAILIETVNQQSVQLRNIV
eukprot:TRINITY_DN11471_c0_g1_i4.p1 TRINITY_DN11471_c0_g1~~TRINITY_DN11471_c0_g1_i4.p1  ORF type:complete len:178 (+),score=35.98 TRINITY_DN11471_c0_g1_i4:845-1378(+)